MEDGSTTKVANKKWRAIVFGLLVVAVGVFLVVVFWPGPKEPEYQGKKLSDWVEIGTGPRGTIRPISEYNNENAKALSSFGTNSLPYLMKWIRFEEPSWKVRASKAYQNLPRQLRLSGIEVWLSCEKEKRRAGNAAYLLALLWNCQFVSPSVTALVDNFKPCEQESSLRRVIWIFAATGAKAAPAVPYLKQLQQNSSQTIQFKARMAIHHITGAGLPTDL